MLKALLSIALLFALSSCSLFETFSKGEMVAQVGNAVLHKSDIDKVLPTGASAADSALFVGQYINSWALKQLMLDMAEKQLPKSDKDVTELLNEYKTQLLVFRYENKYIEERLDTMITELERKAYYAEHKESFVTKAGIVRGRFVKMHNSSPNLQTIKALCAKKDAESAEKLDKLAYNSAYRYDNYENIWVDMPIVARDMEVDISELWTAVEKSECIERKDSSYSNFLQVIEFVLPGEVSPYEYNIERIDEIILSRRKQELISQLHKDIFNEAIISNKVKFAKDEDN